MPVQACTLDGKNGYKYGESGKCYTYTEGNEESRKRAKQKAYIQGAAISARTGEKMEKELADEFESMIAEVEEFEKEVDNTDLVDHDKFIDDGKGLIVKMPEVKKEVIHPENSTTIDEASNINAVCSIFKADDEKRLVYGIVLVPNVEDLQGDIVYAEEIEAAAHDYMRNSRTVFKGHKAKTDAEVVESYIAPVDIPMGSQTIPAGSWIMVTKVHDDAVWEMVKKGELTGYSIGGTGERHSL